MGQGYHLYGFQGSYSRLCVFKSHKSIPLNRAPRLSQEPPFLRSDHFRLDSQNQPIFWLKTDVRKS